MTGTICTEGDREWRLIRPIEGEYVICLGTGTLHAAECRYPKMPGALMTPMTAAFVRAIWDRWSRRAAIPDQGPDRFVGVCQICICEEVK